MARIDYNAYRKLVDEIEKLSRVKNRAYGSDGLTAFGATGCIVRLYDKVCRVKNLVQQGRTKNGDESIEDSLVDMVNYALYAVLLNRGQLIESDKIKRRPRKK